MNLRPLPVWAAVAVLTCTLGACYAPRQLHVHAALDELRPTAGVSDGDAAIPPGATTARAVTEDEAIDEALRNSIERRLAETERKVAEAQVAAASTWPATDFRINDLGWLEGTDTLNKFHLAMRVFFPHPWIQDAAEAAAERGVPLVEAVAEERRGLLRHRVRAAYAEAVAEEARGDVVQRLTAVRRELLDAAREAERRGLGDPLRLSRSELALLDAEEDVRRAAEDRQLALGALAQEMSLPPGDSVRTSGKLAQICPAPPAAVEPTVGDGLLEHPRVRQARLAFERAEAEVESQYARRIPWFSFVQGAYEYDPVADVGERHGFQFSISVSVPLFDWNDGPIAAAEAQRDAAEIRFRSDLRAVADGLRGADESWREAARRFFHIRDRVVPLAQQAIEVYSRALEAGRVSPIELLEARESALSAELALIEAGLACAEASADAERARVHLSSDAP